MGGGGGGGGGCSKNKKRGGGGRGYRVFKILNNERERLKNLHINKKVRHNGGRSKNGR